MNITRRSFCAACLKAGLTCFIVPSFPSHAADNFPEALHYTTLKEGVVRCELCPQGCVLRRQERGFCRVRENRGGKLVSLVYGLPCSLHIDPIEKKPLFHVLPASETFSLATVGCNMRCRFCQNWQISQANPEDVRAREISAAAVAELAARAHCPTIAYTYTEPTVFYEYMRDISIQAQRLGIRGVIHSNGYIESDPLREMCDTIIAANIDLKAFTDRFYREVCSGDLATVTRSLVIIRREKKLWLELTNLVIPGLNDHPEDIGRMAEWIRDALGPEVPLHFSRFYPTYQLTAVSATPVSTLERAQRIAKDAGLQFVYIGNVPGHPGEHTYCPGCGRVIIARSGYVVREVHLRAGVCNFCEFKVPGVWV